MNIPKIVNIFPPLLRRHKLVKLLLFFSPGSRVQLIKFNGSAKLYADISDPFTRSYLFAGGFDPEFFSIAGPFLSKGGVFFDVGANFGFCSFGLIGCLTRNDVEYHLFEASGDICNLLSRSARLYPGRTILVNHCCVTNTPGVSRLNFNSDNFGSAFISEAGTEEVKNLILDNYIREHAVKKIDFLKIDIEGWEVWALKGAMNSLSTGVIETIYIEISPENLSRAGFSKEDCFTLLRDGGFRLFYVKEIDFKSGVAKKGKASTLNVHGYPLTVAKLDNFPAKYLTDVLAIHESSAFLKQS